MEKGNAGKFDEPQTSFLLRAPLPPSFTNFIGHKLLRFLVTVQGLGAFTLITLGVMVKKLRVARPIILPAIHLELMRSGLRLLPMFLFISAALGLVVIGQTVARLTSLGANQYLGTIMVSVVVRELGPFFTAMLVLARSGTSNVIELGTARALGEVEGLEALGIDPIHYLVMPRVIGMALGTLSLTVYFIISALVCGYVWAFIQDVPLRPGDYFSQLAGALSSVDFIVLAVKSSLFGIAISVITCYHGLAQPLGIEEISRATVRAVAQSIIACVLIDVPFILVYRAA